MNWLRQFLLISSIVLSGLGVQAEGLLQAGALRSRSPSLGSGFCRLELMSLGLQSLARREGISFDQLSLKAFVDGSPDLTREQLEKMGATEVAPMGSQGHYVVRSSFNTLLDLTNHEYVRFIEEVPGSILMKQVAGE